MASGIQPNHVSAIKSIEQGIARLTKDYENKTKILNESLEILRSQNQACEHCEGVGKFYYRTTAECDCE